MDDTAYLENAVWVSSHPLTPMSGMLNWSETSLPFYRENFPPLLSYILAVFIKLFGTSIIGLHFVISLFVLASIFLFYDILSFFITKNRLLITFVFFASPFYLPSQNIMLDIPMLSLWLLFFYLLLRGDFKNKYFFYGALGSIVFLACMFKYISLVLIPVLLIVMVARKDYKYLPMVMVPFFGLAGWSLFNYFEYGGIHLLSAGGNTRSLGLSQIRAVYLWTVIMGGVLPFLTPFFLKYVFDKKNLLKTAIWVILALVGFHMLSVQSGRLIRAMNVFFLVNGLALLYVFYKRIFSPFIAEFAKRRQIDIDKMIVLLWFFSVFIFIIFYAPFLAVRHILLALPPIFIAIGIYLEKIKQPSLMKIGAILTIALGILIATADFKYAKIYEYYAAKISTNYSSKNSTTWFLGHWGWQWYAEKEDLQQYDWVNSKIKKGDIIVQPQVPMQLLSDVDTKRVTLIDKIDVPLSKGLIIRTMISGAYGTGFYSINLNVGGIPWYISFNPPEQFYIFKVTE